MRSDPERREGTNPRSLCKKPESALLDYPERWE